ncbi:MAG: VOC family protein [Actinomycetospora chiangmaiensis]|nr:VOC family protein [Actinomycetospora chiangmaiensis]
MDQRVSLITLGVSSLEASRAFYEKLGWKPSPASQGDVVFFQLNGMALSLFPHHLLAEDAKVPPAAPGSFSGVTLAHNCRDKQAVDQAFTRAVAAGARALKAPEDVFWGGYSGYFADPDGHVWELAWNPFFPLDEAGNLSLAQ